MVSILEAKKTVDDVLLEIDAVVATGISTDRTRIMIYVSTCDSVSLEKIPSHIGGFPTEIKCIGVVKPLPQLGYATSITEAYEPSFRLERRRPVVGGISAAHLRINGGTLGAVFRDKITGLRMILSNNHVFANMDAIDESRAKGGDRILQPSLFDGGDDTDAVATLHSWVPLASGENLIDAAVGILNNQDDGSSRFILADDELHVIRVGAPRAIQTGMMAKKYGRTTGADLGEVVDLDAKVLVDYGVDEFLFVDQILVRIPVDAGDSGSLLLDLNNNPVGLLFSASEVEENGELVIYGFANKIRNVMLLMEDSVDMEFETGSDEVPSWATLGVEQPISAEYESSRKTNIGVAVGGIIVTAAVAAYLSDIKVSK